MRPASDQVVVVTGGAGFIGSAVIRELNNRGQNSVVVIDELGTGEKWQNLVGKQFCDIVHYQNFEWLQNHKDRISVIIHLGACSSTVENNADYLLDNNYRFTRRLIEFALHNNIRCIYASSAATYGDGSLGFSDDHSLLESLRPLNMYGYSKHLIDLWLYRENLLDRVVGLKYFNVYGPNEWHKGRMASAILRMVPEALQTKKISLFKSYQAGFTDGEQQRDFVYVKDAVSCTCDFLSSSACGIFNVGTGEAASWNRLACAVFSALDMTPVLEYIPMPSDLIGKYQYYTQANVQKLESALHKKPCAFTLESAVTDYVRNHVLPVKPW